MLFFKTLETKKMKKKEIIKSINAYSAILLRLKTMKNWATKEIDHLEMVNKDTLFNERLIEYLQENITDVQKEMLDFIRQNITTLEQ
jgi:hypothetical protein